MQQLQHILDWFIDSGVDSSSIEGVELRKIRFFNALILIGLFACCGSALVLYISHSPRNSFLAMLVILGTLLILGGVLRFVKRTEIVVQLMLAVLFGLAWFVLTQSSTSTGIFWLYVFAPVSALLLKRKLALFWLFSFCIWVLLLGHVQVLGGTSYSQPQIIAFVVSFLPIGLFMVVYQSITEHAEQEILEKENQLQVLTTRLTQELAFASSAKKQLDSLSTTLSQQNKKLTQSRLALLNLLEDAKELENKLKNSNQKVEEIVIKRTHELSVERARLESTLQSLPIAVLLLDANKKVIDANSLAYELIGRSAIDGSGKLSPVIATQLSRLIKNKLSLSDKINQCVIHDNCILVPEIKYKDMFYRVALGPVRATKDTSHGGVVVVIEDITAQKMLDRSKDEFLMIASHELRTPLTAIRGNAMILSKQYDKKIHDPNFNELTEDIQESSTRLIGIVNDYLELSSLEQGRLVLQNGIVDMQELVKKVVHENQSLALEKNIKLVAKRRPSAKLLVQADLDRTRQIVENLISNAVHYTKKGTVSIELAKTGKYITCRVRDTGIGIAKSSQPELFGKFQQAQENLLTRDPLRSTGLGLYITKLMVEKMGGKIILEHSALGKGSVFAFTLPVATPLGSRKAVKALQ